MTDLTNLLGYNFEPQQSKTRDTISIGNIRLLTDQYHALIALAHEYDLNAESLITSKHCGEHRVTEETGLVTKLALTNLTSKTRILNIPPTLTKLQHLSCDSNLLSALKIQPTLTTLQNLYCGNNQLSELNIPETLTKLQNLGC